MQITINISNENFADFKLKFLRAKPIPVNEDGDLLYNENQCASSGLLKKQKLFINKENCCLLMILILSQKICFRKVRISS